MSKLFRPKMIRNLNLGLFILLRLYTSENKSKINESSKKINNRDGG